jgi:chorismate--pyruvate lyase
MPIKSLILASPPNWHRQQGGSSKYAPKANDIRTWLFETGSLTQRLRNRYGDTFGVVLLQQRLGVPFAEERMALALRPGTQAVIREVGLMAGQAPVILARSIIPQDTVKYADPRLSRLGNQPLGEILFTHPELGRRTLEWTRVPLRFQWNGEAVMGRRSLYTLGQSFPLLVAEFFLPQLLDSES